MERRWMVARTWRRGDEDAAAVRWRGRGIGDVARRGHSDERRGRGVGEGDGGEASSGRGGGAVVREDGKT
jgi:hypothetical protein